MLKPYDNQADVPDELKDHYSRREDGKYHADIPNDHPAVRHNATLLSEKKAAEDKAAKLESDLESAKAGGLPRGHVAVPKADHELLEVVKAEGFDTADKLKVMKAEHGDYKQKAEAAETAGHAAEVAAAMGWDEKKTARLVTKHFDLSQVEVRDDGDGKKQVVAKIKSGEALVEKPFADVVKATPELSDLLPALTAKTDAADNFMPTMGDGTPPQPKKLSDTAMEGWGPKEKKAA